jgi:transposase
VAQFRATIEDKFKDIIARRGGLNRKIRLWVQDETRVGLMPIHRRRITDKGRRALISSEIKREYEYLYGLIEPLTGKDFMLELPNLEAELMEVFLREFVKTDADSLHIILLDNASAHTTEKLQVADNIVFLFFPPNAPELNPMERFWKELKDWLSDYEPPSMKEVSQLVSEGLKSFSAKAISSITSFEYLMTAWTKAIAQY